MIIIRKESIESSFCIGHFQLIVEFLAIRCILSQSQMDPTKASKVKQEGVKRTQVSNPEDNLGDVQGKFCPHPICYSDTCKLIHVPEGYFPREICPRLKMCNAICPLRHIFPENPQLRNKFENIEPDGHQGVQWRGGHCGVPLCQMCLIAIPSCMVIGGPCRNCAYICDMGDRCVDPDCPRYHGPQNCFVCHSVSRDTVNVIPPTLSTAMGELTACSVMGMVRRALTNTYNPALFAQMLARMIELTLAQMQAKTSEQMLVLEPSTVLAGTLAVSAEISPISAGTSAEMLAGLPQRSQCEDPRRLCKFGPNLS